MPRLSGNECGRFWQPAGACSRGQEEEPTLPRTCFQEPDRDGQDLQESRTQPPSESVIPLGYNLGPSSPSWVLESAARKPPGRLVSPRLFGISDLHIDAHTDRRRLENLPSHQGDWLVIAGDLASRIEYIDWALRFLVTKFEVVVWTPGNHELWTLPGDNSGLKGVARYDYLIELSRNHGVMTPEDPFPVFDCGRRYLLAPMFLLYDYSFRPSGTSKEQALRRAWEADTVCSDEFLLAPDPYPNRESWCHARIDYTRTRLEAAVQQDPVILISHFQLRQDLANTPAAPHFKLWCGSTLTNDWHLRFGATLVVMGHLHIPGPRWRDGVLFQEVSPRRRLGETGDPHLGFYQLLP
jgi:predicted phosphodiesterase